LTKSWLLPKTLAQSALSHFIDILRNLQMEEEGRQLCAEEVFTTYGACNLGQKIACITCPSLVLVPLDNSVFSCSCGQGLRKIGKWVVFLQEPEPVAENEFVNQSGTHAQPLRGL
jgi:hypothetical protein